MSNKDIHNQRGLTISANDLTSYATEVTNKFRVMQQLIDFDSKDSHIDSLINSMDNVSKIYLADILPKASKKEEELNLYEESGFLSKEEQRERQEEEDIIREKGK